MDLKNKSNKFAAAEVIRSANLADAEAVLQPLYSAVTQQIVSANKMLDKKDQKTNSQLEEDISAAFSKIINTNFREGMKPEDFERLAFQLAQERTPEARKAAIAAREKEGTVGVSMSILKENLDIQAQINKLIAERSSPYQDQLNLERELITTSQARKANIEFELKALELQKQTQAEIVATITDFSKSKLDKTFQIAALPEEEAKKITEAFDLIGKTKTKDQALAAYTNAYNTIVNEYGPKLTKLQEEELENLNKAIKGIETKAENQEIINNKENLRIALLTKINFVENTTRDNLTGKISLQQKYLDKLKQELDLQRKVSDLKYETATLPTANQDPYIKQRLDLERSLAINGPRQMQDYAIQQQSALLADRLTALNIAFQRGANANQVAGITNAPDYESLENALQEVLNQEAKDINQRVIDAGNAFYNSADAAGANAGNRFGAEAIKIIQGISESQIQSSLEALQESDFANSVDYFKSFSGGMIPPEAMIAASRYFSTKTTETKTNNANNANGDARGISPANAGMLLGRGSYTQNPQSGIIAQTELAMKQLIFAQEKRAMDKRIEIANAEISNAQKIISLRREEREWQQKIKDAAFDLYKTRLNPYQAEKAAAYQSIENDRNIQLQENKDKLAEASLQSRQAGMQFLVSKGANNSELADFLKGKRQGPEILESINKRNLESLYSTDDPFSQKVVNSAEQFRKIILQTGEDFKDSSPNRRSFRPTRKPIQTNNNTAPTDEEFDDEKGYLKYSETPEGQAFPMPKGDDFIVKNFSKDPLFSTMGPSKGNVQEALDFIEQINEKKSAGLEFNATDVLNLKGSIRTLEEQIAMADDNDTFDKFHSAIESAVDSLNQFKEIDPGNMNQPEYRTVWQGAMPTPVRDSSSDINKQAKLS